MTSIPPLGILIAVDTRIKRRATHRLKILGGQIRGLQKMIQKENYCIDIINQCAAAREALLSLEQLLLKNHLNTHVVEQIKRGQKNKAVQEVLSIYKFSNK